MKPTRRWLQFSLRGFLVVLTASAVWLGVVVHRAREQREAVEAIEALGGEVQYDWEILTMSDWLSATRRGEVSRVHPSGPAWLRRIVGDDYFQRVSIVNFGVDSSPCPTMPELQKSVQYLTRLPGLEVVNIRLRKPIPMETENEVKAALPNCSVNNYR